jgi:hypothetical protein
MPPTLRVSHSHQLRAPSTTHSAYTGYYSAADWLQAIECPMHHTHCFQTKHWCRFDCSDLALHHTGLLHLRPREDDNATQRLHRELLLTTRRIAHAPVKSTPPHSLAHDRLAARTQQCSRWTGQWRAKRTEGWLFVFVYAFNASHSLWPIMKGTH